MVVAADPIAAKGILDDENGDTYAETCCLAQLEIQAPVVEERRADYALGDIVCHAHLAVGNEQGERA